MTDRARPLARIKALLADNTSGNISPQDMRDTVESIVNPVVGGGFDNPPSQLVTGLSGDPTLPLSLGDMKYTAVTYLTPTVRQDPGGWFRSTPFESDYGVTQDAWLALPPGIFLWSMYANFVPGQQKLDSPDTVLDGWFSYLDGFGGPFDPIWGGAQYSQAYAQNMYKTGGAALTNCEGHQSNGFLRVPEADNAGNPIESVRVGALYRLKYNGVDKDVDYRSLIVAKIV
jgi:hypothetical protein